jgi:beta-lactamase regulating signal transducer with metallopeptidase domain/HEAT repeat protein
VTHFIDAILEPVLWFAADWSLRWAALIGATALAMLFIRPRRAATRQLMCWVALLGGLFLPVLPRWGGGWHLEPKETMAPPQALKGDPKKNLSGGRQPPEFRVSQGADAPRSESSSVPPAHAPASPPREALGNRRLVVLSLVLCWALGVFVLLVRWLGGAWFLGRLRRGAVDVQGVATETFAACRAELHVRGMVHLLTHPHVRSPVLLGLLRPAILVPTDWTQLPADVQRAALLHELAHVRRRDHWLALLLEMIRVAFFFHPLVRWLLGRLEYERELLCDEVVVGRGVDRRDYARMLLEFARQSGRFALPRLSGSSYLPIGRRRTVKARINHLLEENMERWMGSLPARWAVVLGAGLLALSLGLASYRIRAVEPEKPMPVAPKGKETPKKPAAAKLKREALRYAGKSFDQWYTEMVAELKPAVRADGMKAFGAFGANGYGPEAMQAILEMMRGYDVMIEPSVLSQAGCPALAFSSGLPRSNRDTTDAPVVQAGYGAIRKIGAAGVPALTAAVKSENRNVRRFAVKALKEVGTDARPAVPALLQAMKDEDLETRRRAIETVCVIDPHAKGFVPALSEALKDECAYIRYLAAVKFWEVVNVKDAKPAIPALLEALRDKEYEVRYQALSAVDHIGAGKEAVAAVSRLLGDEWGGTHQRACKFLQSLGPDAKEAIPALIAAVKEKKKDNSNARVYAVITLGKIGPVAKDAVPTLTELLRSDDPDLVKRANEALKKIEGK